MDIWRHTSEACCTDSQSSHFYKKWEVDIKREGNNKNRGERKEKDRKS